MDTRTKILTLEQAAEIARNTALEIVTGHFDVLQAGHVRDLSRVRNGTGSRKLLVVITQPASAVLPLRARAEMVAALGMVDYVVTAEPGGVEPLLEALGANNVTRLEPADERRVRRLIEHVHRRQAG